MNFSAKLRFYFLICKSFQIKVEKMLWFPALQRKVSRGCGGGYSGYGYRSYSFFCIKKHKKNIFTGLYAY